MRLFPRPIPPIIAYAASVAFDCRFFADTDKQINCSGDPATCDTFSGSI